MLSIKLRIIQVYSSKFVTNRVCSLNQWIANHTTMMNDGGGATGGEHGILKTKN